MKRELKQVDFDGRNTVYISGPTPNGRVNLHIEEVDYESYMKGETGNQTILSFNNTESIDAIIEQLTNIKKLLKGENNEYVEFEKTSEEGSSKRVIREIAIDSKIVDHFGTEGMLKILSFVEKNNCFDAVKKVIENEQHPVEEVISFLEYIVFKGRSVDELANRAIEIFKGIDKYQNKPAHMIPKYLQEACRIVLSKNEFSTKEEMNALINYLSKL